MRDASAVGTIGIALDIFSGADDLESLLGEMPVVGEGVGQGVFLHPEEARAVDQAEFPASPEVEETKSLFVEFFIDPVDLERSSAILPDSGYCARAFNRD